MTRATNSPATKKRRKKILNQAEGYFGSKHRLFKTAKEQLMNSYAYAYRDRKQKKRNFRRLWILRINNFCRRNNIKYSIFIRSLVLNHINLNRKQLSEMCINHPDLFLGLIKKVSIKTNEKVIPSIV